MKVHIISGEILHIIVRHSHLSLSPATPQFGDRCMYESTLRSVGITSFNPYTPYQLATVSSYSEKG